MSRRTLIYTVKSDNRDKGKKFQITEMSASRGEAWAMRALLALMAGGVNLPEGFERMGMAGLAEVGIRALSNLKWEISRPLLEEMMECVKIQPDPQRADLIRDLIEQDIEEIQTRVELRVEVFKLHADFLKAGNLSIFGGSKARVDGLPSDTQNT